MSFEISESLKDLQRRTRAFIAEEIIPLEGDPRRTTHGPDEALRRERVQAPLPAGCGNAAAGIRAHSAAGGGEADS
jgi:acyl-CoA dehydrogenase